MKPTTEKELDIALEERLVTSNEFADWFLQHTSFSGQCGRLDWSRSNYVWGPVPVVLPNRETGLPETVVKESETDILVVYALDDGRRVGIHIENKIGLGKFRPNQADFYPQRAAAWKGLERYGTYSEWATVLVAPQAFRDRYPIESEKFGAFISHEDIAAFIPIFDPAYDPTILAAEYEEIDLEALTQALRLEASDVVTPATSKEMLTRMGRNLLQFSTMESILKRALPYMHPRGSKAGADAFVEFRKEIEKETLGKVSKLLIQSMESEEIEVFRAEFKDIIVSRNELVHHFVERFPIGTEAGSREAIVWLDEQYNLWKPFADLCLKFMTITLYGMEKHAVAQGAEPMVQAWHKP